MKYTQNIIDYAKSNCKGMYKITVVENGHSTTQDITPSNKTNDCYSVSKLFTVTALGILFDRGKLDPSEGICDIFDAGISENSQLKQKNVTIDNVMLHRFGIDHGFLDIDTEDINTYYQKYKTRNDFLKIVFCAPLPLTPGKDEIYSDASYYLLSRVVAQKSGVDLYDFLREELFNPLEFEETAWSKCPMGYSMGATGLYIRTSDMAKLGELYQNKGVYGDKRILSKQWCDMVFERGYELRKCASSSYAKGGMNGQMLYINTALNLTVAWTGFDSTGYSAQMRTFLNSL